MPLKNNMTENQEEIKTKAKILSKMSGGTATLEHYPDRGYIVAFRGTKNIIWYTWGEFMRIVEEFKNVYETTNK